MKISISEAKAFATQQLNNVLVKPPYVELVFSTNDKDHKRIIAALANSELGVSKTAFFLIQMGIEKNYADAVMTVNNAIYAPDKQH